MILLDDNSHPVSTENAEEPHHFAASIGSSASCTNSARDILDEAEADVIELSRARNE
jgi:hypothetical protein